MSAIRGKNTTPELLIRRWLFAKGYRYRVYVKTIPGRPDLFLRRYNTAIFVNGCFWHRHDKCKYTYMPKSNVEFWRSKFYSNHKRDLEIKETLNEKGIKQLVIWECTIKNMKKDVEYKCKVLGIIEGFLLGQSQYFEI